MGEIFDRYRKAIITAAGVIVFIIAGLMTMIFTDSGNENAVSKPKVSEPSQPSQNQTVNQEPRVPESNQPSKIIYVYITGEIAKPGVYKLSEDARIFQLVEMAGGFTSKADAESLNLAENVSDGTHIHIGAKLEPPKMSPTIPGMPANIQPNIQPQAVSTRNTAVNPPQTSTGRVNINTAGENELERLPGIGPAIAKRIIEYRNVHGNFSRPEDLINVRGIGRAKLAQILPHVTAMNNGGSYSTGTRITQPQSSAGLIDINRATQKELERLTGVGPATAKRIIEYRNAHGRFTKPEDLMKIRGIGAAKLEKMRSQIIIR